RMTCHSISLSWPELSPIRRPHPARPCLAMPSRSQHPRSQSSRQRTSGQLLGPTTSEIGPPATRATNLD
ncbi:hypothetical protein BGX33_004501, partial [Mortierella sp. NVP41]